MEAGLVAPLQSTKVQLNLVLNCTDKKGMAFAFMRRIILFLSLCTGIAALSGCASQSFQSASCASRANRQTASLSIPQHGVPFRLTPPVRFCQGPLRQSGSPLLYEELTVQEFKDLSSQLLRYQVEPFQFPIYQWKEFTSVVALKGKLRGKGHRELYSAKLGTKKVFIKVSSREDKYITNSVLWMILLSAIDMGPSFYGYVVTPQGLGIISDLVTDVTPEKVPFLSSNLSGQRPDLSGLDLPRVRAVVKSMRDAFVRFQVPHANDLQMILDRESRPWIIDPEFFPIFFTRLNLPATPKSQWEENYGHWPPEVKFNAILEHLEEPSK